LNLISKQFYGSVNKTIDSYFIVVSK